VFGLSFGELCVLIIVAVVVLGPKELPRYLRKAGQFAAKLRRLAYDMREKSGIDEVLRTEGLDRDIAEIRRLARGEVDGIRSAVRLEPIPPKSGDTAAKAVPTLIGVGASAAASAPPVEVDRAREYPCEGADSYGALPDTALVYDNTLPASPLAEDAVYARGEEPPAVAAAAAAPTTTATPEPTTP
jgi:sec-independent protein translocase protein TatB